jgi:hypothetical protein
MLIETSGGIFYLGHAKKTRDVTLLLVTSFIDHIKNVYINALKYNLFAVGMLTT